MPPILFAQNQIKMSRQNSKQYESADALIVVPKDFLTELKENQERIIDMLGSFKPEADAIGDYITEKEASKLLGRKTTWFWNLRKIGKLPFTKVGNKIFYQKASIIQLLDANKRNF
jgi:hypothetical protein